MEGRVKSLIFFHCICSLMNPFIQPIFTEHPQLCTRHWAKGWNIVVHRQALDWWSFQASCNRTYSETAGGGIQWAAPGGKMELNSNSSWEGYVSGHGRNRWVSKWAFPRKSVELRSLEFKKIQLFVQKGEKSEEGDLAGLLQQSRSEVLRL